MNFPYFVKIIISKNWNNIDKISEGSARIFGDFFVFFTIFFEKYLTLS